MEFFQITSLRQPFQMARKIEDKLREAPTRSIPQSVPQQLQSPYTYPTKEVTPITPPSKGVNKSGEEHSRNYFNYHKPSSH